MPPSSPEQSREPSTLSPADIQRKAVAIMLKDIYHYEGNQQFISQGFKKQVEQQAQEENVRRKDAMFVGWRNHAGLKSFVSTYMHDDLTDKKNLTMWKEAHGKTQSERWNKDIDAALEQVNKRLRSTSADFMKLDSGSFLVDVQESSDVEIRVLKVLPSRISNASTKAQLEIIRSSLKNAMNALRHERDIVRIAEMSLPTNAGIPLSPKEADMKKIIDARMIIMKPYFDALPAAESRMENSIKQKMNELEQREDDNAANDVLRKIKDM